MSGRVLAVIGAAGGAGGSVVASGLALALARRGPGVQLVDLDMERGDLAGEWDAPDERTLADLLPVVAELRCAHLRNVRHAHPSGVDLVASPARPGAAGGWGGDAIGRLLAVARTDGEVVADVGSGPSQAALDAARAAERVVVVATPTLRGARRVLRLRDLLDGREDAIRLVVNEGAGHSEMGASALGTAVGLHVAGVMPASPREAAEIGAGRWPRARRGGLARAVSELAGAL